MCKTGLVGGPCDYCVTPVPIGLGFWTALGMGLRGPDLGIGLDNSLKGLKEFSLPRRRRIETFLYLLSFTLYSIRETCFIENCKGI